MMKLLFRYGKSVKINSEQNIAKAFPRIIKAIFLGFEPTIS